MIKGLHHNAYRCRDSEETRRFYEDFLGLPLAQALRIRESKSGRRTDTLHTFYRMDDGSCLAFFEAPDMPFEFKEQHDFDLHIALEVDRAHMMAMKAKGEAEGREVRGVADERAGEEARQVLAPRPGVADAVAEHEQHRQQPERREHREADEHECAHADFFQHVLDEGEVHAPGEHRREGRGERPAGSGVGGQRF